MAEPDPAEAQGLSAAMLRAVFAQLMQPQLRPPNPWEEAIAHRAKLAPPDDFQQLVDEAVLAGQHVHTWRNGELRCPMGVCE